MICILFLVFSSLGPKMTNFQESTSDLEIIDFSREKWLAEKKAAETAAEFEREKWAADQAVLHRAAEFERQKWDAAILSSDKELALRNREVTAKEIEQRRAQWTSPLFLAVTAAAIAAFGNGVVAWVNVQNQAEMELQKGSTAKALADATAESARVLEAIKTMDPDKAAVNLDFLVRVGLIFDPNKVARVEAYLRTRPKGQGASLPATMEVENSKSIPPISSPSPSNSPSPSSSASIPNSGQPLVQKYETDWLQGGFSQPQACAIGRNVVSSQHPNKTVLLINSFEQNQKSLFGNVTYKYTCIFQVQ